MNFLQGFSTLHIDYLVHIFDNLEFFVHSCFWFPLKVGWMPCCLWQGTLWMDVVYKIEAEGKTNWSAQKKGCHFRQW